MDKKNTHTSTGTNSGNYLLSVCIYDYLLFGQFVFPKASLQSLQRTLRLSKVVSPPLDQGNI